MNATQHIQFTTNKGNILQLFYNNDTGLVVVDLIAANETGGNEFVRMNINESKMLGQVTKPPAPTKAPPKPKNECAKMRPVESPYEIWKSDSWTWLVLKKWQVDDNKPFARWFCHVTSPMCPHGEMGDVYVSEIKAQAARFK